MRRITAAALLLWVAHALAFSTARAGDDVASRPWAATWIWRPSPAPMQLHMTGIVWTPPADDTNTTIQFRREITLDRAPERATARLTADSRYQLFVNGAFVARGPAPCDPLRQSFDIIDLTRYLTAGKNTIAAQVHFYGEATGLWRRAIGDWWAGTAVGGAERAALGAGGFLCEVSDGVKILAATDAAWKYREAAEWKRPTRKINPAFGFVEVYDANVAPEGWTKSGFDDTSWKASNVLESGGRTRPPIEPYPALEARDIAPLTESVVEPIQILTAGYVEERLDGDPATAMRNERFVGPEFAYEAVLGNPVKLTAGPGMAASVVYDFGEEIVGFPQLDIAEAEAGTTLDVAWGERTWGNLVAFGKVHPELAIPVPGDGRGVAFDPIRGDMALRYVAKAGAQSFTARERVGFRYLQVTARGKPLTLRAVNAVRVKYGVPMTGEFECSDPLLTEIWAAGKRTLEACLLDAFIDGPGREQRQYLGDARVQARVARAVLGDERPARRALREFFLTPRADGMLPIVAPGDAERMGTVIPDYALHGILMLGEYYEATGDEALVAELLPSVKRVLDWFDARATETGLIGDVPGWLFLDWAQIDRRGVNTVLNSLYLQSIQECRGLPNGLSLLSPRHELLMKDGMFRLFQNFFDPKKRLYADALDNGVLSSRTSIHTNASLILTEAFKPHSSITWVTILGQEPQRIVDPQSPLLPQKEIDDSTQLIGASPFFQTFVHEALARCGEHKLALDDIRRHWAPMVAHGNKNLWEGWERTLDSSDCHAWSASPTAFLTQEILGVRYRIVKETSAAARLAVTITPDAGDLTKASGVVPTPHGPVRVSWEAKDGVITVVRGEIPAGATANIGLGQRIQVVRAGAFEVKPE